MVLSRDRVRSFYDRLGRWQDFMHAFEGGAIDELIGTSAFREAAAVLELGCGSGRLGARLLDRELPPSATYLGMDLSRTMVELARRRLRRFGDRAEVRGTEGEPCLDVPDGVFDRFVATYVLDILPEGEIRAILAEARRVLQPGGLLCLASLCPGRTPTSRLVTRAWNAVFTWRPALLGGCRPIDLPAFIREGDWRVCHSRVVVRCGFPTEIVVAARATGPTRGESEKAGSAPSGSASRGPT